MRHGARCGLLAVLAIDFLATGCGESTGSGAGGQAGGHVGSGGTGGVGGSGGMAGTGGSGGAIDANTVDAMPPCSAGGCMPIVLAPNQVNPSGLAIDRDNVYWTNFGPTGAILKVSKSGGGVTTLVSSQSFPEGITVDENSLYWTTYVGSGAVMRAGLGGGGAAAVAVNQAPNVYWSNFGDGTIRSIPKAGGTAIVLVSGQAQPSAMTTDKRALFWINYGTPLGGSDGAVMKTGL